MDILIVVAVLALLPMALATLFYIIMFLLALVATPFIWLWMVVEDWIDEKR